METNDIKINETHLVVLKKDLDSKDVVIDYEIIINPIRDHFDNLYKYVKNSQDIDNLILNLRYFIKSDYYNDIIKDLDFCENLSLAYQDIKEIDIKFRIILDKLKNIDYILNSEEMELLLEFIGILKKRDLPFSIAKTYEKCHSDNSILAFSHRKRGWTIPEFELVKDFSIQFYTNFGYGSKSYFYTKLKYKNIDIVPFSDWIIYEKADFYEIIRYTIKHELKNESWLEAMEYAKNAIEDFNSNEQSFIDKFLLKKCEELVDGLENILENNTFNFKINNSKDYSYTFNDKRLLLNFRGEKITGALNFVSKLNEYEKIFEVNSFIERIKSLNLIIEPILINELKIIEEDIKKAEIEYISIKEKSIAITANYNFFIKMKNKLINVYNKNNNENSRDINFDDCFVERHPEFKEINTQFIIFRRRFEKINNLKLDLNKFRENFNGYLTKIEEMKLLNLMNY